jgi:hypothetical protein
MTRWPRWTPSPWSGRRRGLLKAADAELEAQLRGLLGRDDDYASAGKPVCDWDDRAAREALVDALARDAMALLAALDGRELGPVLSQAAALLATVVGQDLDADADGVFRIVRKVARDRVISTVDPAARHGHKTAARGFDGYKGHVAIDPDTEIITATTATAGNTGDAEAATALIAEDLPTRADDDGTAEEPERDDHDDGDGDGDDGDPIGEVARGETDEGEGESLGVYGDAAYGAGELLAKLERAGADIKTKVQPPNAPGGRFPKGSRSTWPRAR